MQEVVNEIFQDQVKIKTIRFRYAIQARKLIPPLPVLDLAEFSFQLATLGRTTIGGVAKVAGSEERNATTVESDEEGAEALLLGLCFPRTNKRDLPPPFHARYRLRESTFR